MWSMASAGRILVGYDGSASSRRALDRAIEEAHRGAHVTVLSVEEMPLSPDEPRYFGTLDDIRPDEDAPLEAPPDVVAHLREAREIAAGAGLDVDLVWSAGDPGRELVDTARRIRATTIVVGEHHHGRLASLFQGGDIDEEVQREAGCDVILA
jgi:nucleotide-binding universal stress UspA family protein